MIGAAQTAVDDLADRQVGAEMRTPGALTHRLARCVPVRHHPCTQKIPADHRTRRQVAGQRDRIPAAMEARLRRRAVLRGQLALRTHHAHGCLLAVLLPWGPNATTLWYRP